MKYLPYYIRWRDAFHPNDNGWMNEKDIAEFLSGSDFIVDSIGYVIHEDKYMLTLSSMIDNEQKSFSHIERIPIGCIIEKKRIKLE